MTEAMSQQPSKAGSTDATIAYRLHGNCYLNITYHCTLRCAFCPKFRGSWEVQNFDLRLYSEPSADEVLEALGDASGDKEVVFCGLGEPTKRLDTLLDVSRELKRLWGSRIRINTDGLANLVHGRDITPELDGLVDVLSISMNAQDEVTYNRHCRPRLPGAYAAMLDFAQGAKAYVPEVTLTAIDGLPGVDIEACARIAADLGVGFRRRVLDIVG